MSRRKLDAEFVVLYADLRAQKRLGLVQRFIEAFARHDRIWVEEIPAPANAVWIITAGAVIYHLAGASFPQALRVWW